MVDYSKIVSVDTSTIGYELSTVEYVEYSAHECRKNESVSKHT